MTDIEAHQINDLVVLVSVLWAIVTVLTGFCVSLLLGRLGRIEKKLDNVVSQEECDRRCHERVNQPCALHDVVLKALEEKIKWLQDHVTPCLYKAGDAEKVTESR